MKGLQSDNTYCLMFAQDKIFVSKSLYQQILSSAWKYNMAARSSLFHYNPSKRLERDEDYTGFLSIHGIVMHKLHCTGLEIVCLVNQLKVYWTLCINGCSKYGYIICFLDITLFPLITFLLFFFDERERETGGCSGPPRLKSILNSLFERFISCYAKTSLKYQQTWCIIVE